MEIEMKYGIRDKECAEHIWDDEDLLRMGDADSKESVLMKASYFDTEDCILSKNDIAFRVRLEGSRVVATLKWNGVYQDGVHTREEINVPMDDDRCFLTPSPEIFKESDQGKAMMALIGDKPLHSLMETNFVRRRMRIDSGKAICEIALDTGEIITDAGKAPICEMEIELFSGEESEVVAIGTMLAEKYGLVPEETSKYARGLAMLKAGDDGISSR